MRQNSPLNTVSGQRGGGGEDEEYLYVNIPLQQMIQPQGLVLLNGTPYVWEVEIVFIISTAH